MTKLWEIMNQIEDQEVHLEQARTVLYAAADDLEDIRESNPSHERILLLLYAAGTIFNLVEPALSKTVTELQEADNQLKKMGVSL